MSYSTVAEVRLALAPSSADLGVGIPNPITNTAADLTNAQLQDAINQADSFIDSFIGGFYVTPVAANPDTTIPHPIDFLSRDIASYLATLTFRKNQNLDSTDPIQLRYEIATSFLTNIQNGKGTLSIPVNSSPGNSIGVGQVVNPYNGQLFGASDWDLEYAQSCGYPAPGIDGWRPGIWNGRRW